MRRNTMRSTAEAAAVSAITVTLLHLLGGEVASASMEVTLGGNEQAISVPSSVAAAIAASALAGGVAAIATRVSPRPRRAFTIAIAIGFALSLPGAIAGAADTATAITLLAMHLGVLGAVVLLMRPVVPADHPHPTTRSLSEELA